MGDVSFNEEIKLRKGHVIIGLNQGSLKERREIKKHKNNNFRGY